MKYKKYTAFAFVLIMLINILCVNPLKIDAYYDEDIEASYAVEISKSENVIVDSGFEESLSNAESTYNSRPQEKTEGVWYWQASTDYTKNGTTEYQNGYKARFDVDPDDTNNKVLYLQSGAPYRHALYQILPKTATSTGRYTVKFKAKALEGDSAYLMVGLNFIEDEFIRSSRCIPNWLGKHNDNTTAIEVTSEWKNYTMTLDVYGPINYPKYTDAYVDNVFVQLRNLKTNADKTATVDVLVDDFEVVPPDCLQVNSVSSKVLNPFGGEVDITFNYEGIYEELITLDNICVTYEDGSEVNGVTIENILSENQYVESYKDFSKVNNNIATYTPVLKNKVKGIKIKYPVPDITKGNSNITIDIKNLVSRTPKVDNGGNLTNAYSSDMNMYKYFHTASNVNYIYGCDIDTRDSSFVRMDGTQTITLKANEKLEIIDTYLSGNDLNVNVKSNINNFDIPVYVVWYEEDANSNVSGDVSYKKALIKKADGDTNSTVVTFENADVSDVDDVKTHLFYSLDENLTALADATTSQINISRLDFTIDLDVSLPNGFMKPKVTAIVLNPDESGNVTSLDITSSSEEGKISNIYSIKEFEPESNDFLYKTSECPLSGTYKVIMYANGNTFAVKDAFISGKTDNEKFMQGINNDEGTKEEQAKNIYTVLEKEDEEQKIRLDDKYYDMLDDSSKQVLGQILQESIPYKDIDAFSEAFSKQTLLLAMIRTNDAQVLYNLIDKEHKFDDVSSSKIKEILGLEEFKKLSVYKTYDALTDDEKKVICSSIIKNVAEYLKDSKEDILVKTVADFKNIFMIEVLNNRILATNIHSEITDIVNTHNDVLKDVDYTKYKKLETKLEAVNAAIKSNAGYVSVNELVELINNKTEAKLNETTSTSKGSGGSGSSKGSSSYSIGGVTAHPNTQVVVNNPKMNCFDDLSGVEWAVNSINGLYERNIVSGKGNNKFEPYAFVTREEFVKMLVLASKMEIAKSEEEVFSDVTGDVWYKDYVTTAAVNKITSGIGDNAFGVGLNITRQDLFVMCANAAYGDKYTDKEILNRFSDCNDISEYASEKIALLVSNGIVSGSEGKINPLSNATRAEAAKIIFGLIDILEK